MTLAYLYWEPRNAPTVASCVIHEAELAEFARRVGDPRARFVRMSYRQLWDEWQAGRRPSWLREHVAALRRRHDLTV